MLAFESMFALNPHRAEQTAELLACSLCMMDSRRIACDTYTSMVDHRMKSLVRGELLARNRQAWEEFLDEEAKRTKALVERLLQVIADESLLWKYRQDAVETLGRLGDSRAVEPIIALIGDKSMYSTVIIDALKNLGDRRAVEPLLAFLSQGNEYERGHAAEALGEMGESRALTPLAKALRQHKEYFTRRKVIWALGKLGDSRAIRPLEDTLRGILSDDSIRERDKSQLEAEIKRALQKINDRGSSGTVGSGR
jgi:HEAT repeat protein